MLGYFQYQRVSRHDTAKAAYYNAANSQDPFPWCLVVDGAAMGDNARVATYIATMQGKYVNAGFPWPFYNAEAGWFMRANSYMMGNGL